MTKIYRSAATEPPPEPLTKEDVRRATRLGVGLWLAGWSGFLAVELWLKSRNGTTLSRAARTLTWQDHEDERKRKQGRMIFTALLAGGAAALWAHITQDKRFR